MSKRDLPNITIIRTYSQAQGLQAYNYIRRILNSHGIINKLCDSSGLVVKSLGTGEEFPGKKNF